MQQVDGRRVPLSITMGQSSHDLKSDPPPDDPAQLKLLLLEAQRTIAQLAAKVGTDTSDTQAIIDEQRAALAAKQAIIDEKQAVIDEAHGLIQKLALELVKFRKWYYGRKADRLTGEDDDVSELLRKFTKRHENMPVEEGEADGKSPETAAASRRIRTAHKKGGRRDIASMDELPKVRYEHDLPESDKVCPCCNKPKDRIGDISTWQIELIPATVTRIEHVQRKYACNACEAKGRRPGIALAPKPRQPIEKGMPGPSLLAFLATSKYSDYLPLYRLEDILGRAGFEIDRGTQSRWCRDMAEMVKPLYNLMVQRVLSSHLICTDDTIMPMQAKDKTHKARMWCYVGDAANPYNLFDFTLSRGRDGPMKFLVGFNQVLLADGYGGYDGVVVDNQIQRAGCWAHARRKFTDAERSNPTIAAAAVEIIGRLYETDEQAAAMTVPDRLAYRQLKCKPIVEELKVAFTQWKSTLLPQHPLTAAMQYSENQWKELTAFLEDGAIPLDNNVSEREMKRIVLNRKNSLFVGNERGGQTAAILASITSTCKRHEIDPQRYLTQLFVHLHDTPMSQLSSWLPDEWKKRDTPPP